MNKGTIPLKMQYVPSIESLHILSSCLVLDEKERISTSELVDHPFVNLNFKTTPIFQEYKLPVFGRQTSCPDI